jgi:hypothetical protein
MNSRSPSAQQAQHTQNNPRPSIIGRISSTRSPQAGSREENFDFIPQPETRPISQEQLVAEVKGIYASLVLVETKCIEVDNKQAALAQADAGAPPKLNNEQWEALKVLSQSFFKGTYSKVVGFKRKALRIMFNGYDTFARPDTASDQDIMTEAFANEHDIAIQRGETDQSLFLLGAGKYVKSVGKAQVPISLFGNDFKEEFRWFHVLEKCPVPLILGMKFVEKIKLYTRNKHLLVDCPFNFGSLPTLKWVGSPRGFVNFRANGKQLVGCADTGSDLDFLSLRCAKRLGFKIDSRPSARSRVMLADESIVETVGQVHISSIELSYFESFEMSFHVLPGLASEVIFSEDFLDQMDAFNTCAQIKDTEDPYQQQLNTLISLGPIQAFLNRTWTPDVANTAQQEHDQVIEPEIYRRNNVKRSIRKMRDEDKAAAARATEETKKSIFDQGHARCTHCIGANHGTATQS